MKITKAGSITQYDTDNFCICTYHGNHKHNPTCAVFTAGRWIGISATRANMAEVLRKIRSQEKGIYS